MNQLKEKNFVSTFGEAIGTKLQLANVTVVRATKPLSQDYRREAMARVPNLKKKVSYILLETQVLCKVSNVLWRGVLLEEAYVDQ